MSQVTRNELFSKSLSTKSIVDGPLSVLKKRIADKLLMPDEFQTAVAGDLQKLYEQIQDYEPKPKSFSKWFSFGKKPADDKFIKGLYIYGSVGGGKTMLMDLFFDCCQVFDLEPIFRNRKFHVFCLILDPQKEARSLQFIHD